MSSAASSAVSSAGEISRTWRLVFLEPVLFPDGFVREAEAFQFSLARRITRRSRSMVRLTVDVVIGLVMIFSRPRSTTVESRRVSLRRSATRRDDGVIVDGVQLASWRR
jgi:hypothetical protein